MHEFIEDTSVNIDLFDDVLAVEVCKYCDCQRWTWIRSKNSKIAKHQYMLDNGTQYWNPEEECSDKYKLRQLKLF